MQKRFILALLYAILILIIFGCVQPEEAPVTEQMEEVTDTGILVIESAPSEAQVYVDNELKGQTPLTIYNFPVGTYKVLVKKDGYSDFEKTIAVKVGLTEEVDAALNPVKKAEPKPTEKEETMPQKESAVNKINLSSFALYLDFEKRLFTETRTEKSDLFSRKYDTYLDIVALTPAKMKATNMPLSTMNRADCINADTTVVQLYSKQTLCVITVEGNYFALGGSWEKTPVELEFVQLS